MEKHVQELKQFLLTEKEKIFSELRERIGNTRIGHQAGDAIDGSVDTQDREMNLLFQGRERSKLEQIESAIQRLALGDYGYCEECGEAIAKGRLRVFPLAQMCVQCKEEEERTGLHIHSHAQHQSGVSRGVRNE